MKGGGDTVADDNVAADQLGRGPRRTNHKNRKQNKRQKPNVKTGHEQP
jgi:hypothetical protein